MKRRDFLKRVAPASLLPFAINGQPITAYGKLFGTNAEDFTETEIRSTKALLAIEINKGIINDETKSLGVIRADSDLWNEYCMDSIKKNKTYSNIKKLLE